jgi:IS5 family transposase
MIHNATFVHSDHGHAKVNKTRENEAKRMGNKYGSWTKK